MAILMGFPPSNTISTGRIYSSEQDMKDALGYIPRPVLSECRVREIPAPWKEPGLSQSEKFIRKWFFEQKLKQQADVK